MKNQFKNRLSSTANQLYLAVIALLVKSEISPDLRKIFISFLKRKVVDSGPFSAFFTLLEALISAAFALVFICSVDALRFLFSKAKVNISFIDENERPITKKLIQRKIEEKSLIKEPLFFAVNVSIPGKITHYIFNKLKIVTFLKFVPTHFQFVVADDSPTEEGKNYFWVQDQSTLVIPWTIDKTAQNIDRRYTAKLMLGIIPTGDFQSEVNVRISSNLTNRQWINSLIGFLVKIIFGKQIIGDSNQFIVEVERK